jgi:hypothetical protein
MYLLTVTKFTDGMNRCVHSGVVFTQQSRYHVTHTRLLVGKVLCEILDSHGSDEMWCHLVW